VCRYFFFSAPCVEQYPGTTRIAEWLLIAVHEGVYHTLTAALPFRRGGGGHCDMNVGFSWATAGIDTTPEPSKITP
jgi:hypothetical protein